MNKILELGATFIWENGRLLEKAIFEFYFHDGSPRRILEILRTYQNEDGGFGHALEPDLRAPGSQPLFVEFAMRILYDCHLREANLAYRACDFISQHANLWQGIPMIFEIAWSYPHASHMNNPAVIQPSMERLSSLVGLLNWQGVDHPWLQEAVDLCLEYVAKTRFTDAHTILNTYCLLESLSQERLVEELFIKLSHDLFQADFFCIDTPVTTYGLTPLSFAPSPNSYCHRIFTDKQIANHLTDLEGQQEKDGGWPIQWDPPKGIARQEWRAYKTVMALFTLHAYGRI